MRWRKPMAQAREIGKRKTAKGRANAVHVWSLMVKEAFRAMPVPGVQHAAKPDMDPSPRAGVRGSDGVEDAGPDRARVFVEGEGAAR
jgi:hypothetical protein